MKARPQFIVALGVALIALAGSDASPRLVLPVAAAVVIGALLMLAAAVFYAAERGDGRV